jgi:lysine-N-methylase
MKRFRCIGGDCESSCCSGGWNITVDREHYDKTRSAMSGSPATRQEFDAKMRRVKTVARTDKQHALLVLQTNGDCTFLGGDRLCSLQKRYGEEVLSDTCTVYPRSVSRAGARLEQAGVTSCPEVARQLLLHKDALELDFVDKEVFERPPVRQTLPDHPAMPYARYHDELRNLMMDLLNDDTYPLSTRLCFTAYFAHRTLPFMQVQTRELDEGRLLLEVERIQDPDVRADLHREFADRPIGPVFSSRVVMALLSARSPVSGLRELIDSVIEEYSAGAASPLKSNKVPSEAEARDMVLSYQRHTATWDEYKPRIDGYLANYAKNYWALEWYVTSPDMLSHAVMLFARLASIRFLLLGHPLLVAALDAPAADKERALDRAVVHTVQKFSRAFEHDVTFNTGLKEKLADAKLVTLAHAVCLASF